MNVDMVMMSGEKVDFREPSQTEILIDDLKLGIANIRRYNGQVDWTLAQHLELCVLLAQLHFPNEPLIQGFVAAHDLHECYVGDVASGLKKYLKEYQLIEDAWEVYVHESLGLDLGFKTNDISRAVSYLDRRALEIEMSYFNHPGYEFVRTTLFPYKEELDLIKQIATKTPEQSADTVMIVIHSVEKIIREMKNGN